MQITTRRAHADDLPILASIWHEKLTILAASDRRYAPKATAAGEWSVHAEKWLQDDSCALIAACADEKPIGYILGAIQAALPGLQYGQLGAVTQIAIDAHGYYSGAGRALVSAMQAWFAEKGVRRVVVYAPHRSPSEQAFWRALGAVVWMDGLWLK